MDYKLKGIFYDYKKERSMLEHPALTITVIVLAYFVIGVGLAMIVPENPSAMEQAKSAILGTGATLLIFLLGAKYLGKHSWKSLGFQKKAVLKKYLIGLFIGFISFGAVVLITMLFGMQHLVKNEVSMSTLLLFFVTFMVQGASEEIMFRSVIFSEISSRFGFIIGLISSSILFALIHAGSSTMGVVNMFFYGSMMALAYYWSENIILNTGMHTMWNFAEGNIFGVSVSGHSIGKEAILKSTFSGNPLISGGTNFGSESGLICTFVLIVSCIIFGILVLRKQKKSYK
ncbi:MAG: CPBP family intramembrane metalloprotease [Oceanivirga sp.]|nr:CPBP family intramembrane metalloprotease [Oceanivirga sp.]